MRFIDTHCHLDRMPTDVSLSDVINRAEKAGVRQFIVPGVSGSVIWPERFAAYSNIGLAWGVHPCFAAESDFDAFAENSAICGYKPVAIGECGLDRRSSLAFETQMILFRRHLEFAKKNGLPVIVHLVGFQQAGLELIESCFPLPPVIMHSWSGSAEMAARFIKTGCCISFSASILKKTDAVRKIFGSIDLAGILVETDSPDMPLPDWHMAHNEPSALPGLVKSLAEITQINVAELAEILYTNATRVFML